MDNAVCPKCGADSREHGKLFPYPWGFQGNVRFQAENSYPFDYKNTVIAIACMSCGYIELYLSKVLVENQSNT